MAEKFERLGDLILKGQKGDWYNDLPSGKDRSVTTYVLESSRVETESGKVHHVGETVGTFRTITTRHHGKSELAGRQQYVYMCTAREDEKVSTEEDSLFIRHTFSMGSPSYLLDKSGEAKRYSRKRLLQMHADALESQGVDPR